MRREAARRFMLALGMLCGYVIMERTDKHGRLRCPNCRRWFEKVSFDG